MHLISSNGFSRMDVKKNRESFNWCLREKAGGVRGWLCHMKSLKHASLSSLLLPHPSNSPRPIWSHLWHLWVSKVVTDKTETLLSAALCVCVRVWAVLLPSWSLSLSLSVWCFQSINDWSQPRLPQYSGLCAHVCVGKVRLSQYFWIAPSEWHTVYTHFVTDLSDRWTEYEIICEYMSRMEKMIWCAVNCGCHGTNVRGQSQCFLDWVDSLLVLMFY